MTAYNDGGMKICKQGATIPLGMKLIRLPCGGCIGCRLDRAQMWTTRCIHEAKMHTDNCFLTLTYSDENNPVTLVKKHHKDFMKALRHKYHPKIIRFYMCGEYGSNLQRPHYHFLIFGHRFDDLILFSEREGINTFTSETLDKIWGLGFCTVGEVTKESAGYVARYCLKKIGGKNAEQHYQTTHPATGEILTIQPEYNSMSTKPGIAKSWYEKYKSDVFPADMVILKDGTRVKTPRYYDLLLNDDEPETIQRIKEERTKEQDLRWADQTRRRLATRETVKKAQIKTLKRETI